MNGKSMGEQAKEKGYTTKLMPQSTTDKCVYCGTEMRCMKTESPVHGTRYWHQTDTCRINDEAHALEVLSILICPECWPAHDKDTNLFDQIEKLKFKTVRR